MPSPSHYPILTTGNKEKHGKTFQAQSGVKQSSVGLNTMECKMTSCNRIPFLFFLWAMGPMGPMGLGFSAGANESGDDTETICLGFSSACRQWEQLGLTGPGLLDMRDCEVCQ